MSDVRERVMLDRYAKRSINAPKVGDQVVATILNERTEKDEQKIGEVVEVLPDPTTKGVSLYSVALKDDVAPRASWEKISLPEAKVSALEETTYFQICDRVVDGVKKFDPNKKFVSNLRRFMYEEALVAAGRILVGVGRDDLTLTLFNCFVKQIPGDSRTAISAHWANIFEIFSRGGGCGWCLSILRPRGALVRGSNGKSSGACSWATHYAAITSTIEQGGSRRGASLQAIDVWHPDVLEFIQFKSMKETIACPSCGNKFQRDKKLWEGSNVSILISDAFMKAVEADAPWDLVFPDTQDPEYNKLWDGNLQKWKSLKKKIILYKTMPARELWNAIVVSSWVCGDPGLLFIDRINRLSNSWYYNRLICTNPCAEECLPKDGICNLSHLNLPKFIKSQYINSFPKKEAAAEDAQKKIDVAKLRLAIQTGIRFLDDIIDINVYHDDNELEKNAKAERRLGLGILGLGELLIRCGLRYGSSESLKFVDWLFAFIKEESYKASIALAKIRGPFPNFDAKKYTKGEFIKTLPPRLVDSIYQHGIRNVTVNTAAPTGTVGTMVGTSTGIEPYFDLEFTARSRVGVTQETINIFEALRARFGKDPDKWPSYIVTANDITIDDHIAMQAVVQRHIDSSISKTINLPEEATREDVSKAFMLMYSSGCKGGTIYRDGSKEEQVFEKKNKKGAELPMADVPVETIENEEVRVNIVDSASYSSAILRSPIEEGHSITRSVETPIGKVHITLRFHPVTGEPYDMFCQAGKGDVNADVQGFARLISLILRMPDKASLSQSVRLQMIVDQLSDIRGSSQVGIGPSAVYSLPDGLGKFLNKYLSANCSLPGLPMGDEQLSGFAEKVLRYKDKDQLLQFLRTGIIQDEVLERACSCDGKCKKEEEAKKELPQAKGRFKKKQRMDFCPSCGNATLMRQPGHCTYCTNQNCSYSEC